MRGNTSRLVVGVLLLSAVLIGSAAAQDESTDPRTIAETQEHTETAITLVELSQQQPLHIGTGLALGAGVGLVAGSLAMFGYWSKKL